MMIDRLLQGLSPRVILVLTLIWLSQAALIGRLWVEQVQLGPRHREDIASQSVRRLRLAPVRGRILCRDGTRLTDNQPSYEALFHLHEMRQPRRKGKPTTMEFVQATIDRTAQLIGRPNPVTPAMLQRHASVYPALPFRAFTNLSEEELARLTTAMPGVPGLEISTQMQRVYPQGPLAAHLVGFVGRRNPAEEDERGAYDYYLPELAGRAGLERAFDRELGGRGGMRLMRVDSLGMFHGDLAQPDAPQPGADLVLTLDARAQRLAEELLAGERGALVLLHCSSGAVLAMASTPGYDLAQISPDYYRELASDTERLPLLNRALGGGYSPGSIVKPLVALTALEHGVIAPATEIDCPGYYELGGTRIRCAARFGHGRIDLGRAIEVSCNTYFIAVGLQCGVDHLREVMASAGIGQPTGLELTLRGDQGLVPDRAEKQRRQREAWHKGDTALVSIGQGFITLSPLQAAVYAAAMGNGGYLLRPHLVKAIRGQDGSYLQVTRPDVRGQLEVDPAHLALVRAAMHRVVHGATASAPEARTPLIDLAGKTGTAEIGPPDARRKNTWFICFGPYDAPTYAMAVLVEEGVSGGRSAAPLARQFFERYLQEGEVATDDAPSEPPEAPADPTPGATVPPARP